MKQQILTLFLDCGHQLADRPLQLSPSLVNSEKKGEKTEVKAWKALYNPKSYYFQ